MFYKVYFFMEIDEFDCILSFIDEFKAEDHNTRLHAINSLDIIASAIGEEKTRLELVPYMSELLVDENDEVLLAIASKLAELSKYIGDNSHLVCLLQPLHTLCCKEQSVVQEKAASSLIFISSQLSTKDIEDHFIPLVFSLSNSEWVYGRISACALFNTALSRITTQSLYDELSRLASDTVPAVRKAVAVSLNSFSENLLGPNTKKLVSDLLNDENEGVRQMAIGNIANHDYSQDEIKEIIQVFACDRSWRVRYTLFENIPNIIVKLDSIADIASYLFSCLQDSESEVRYIALKNIAKISEKLYKPVIELEVLPVFEKLSKDSSSHVKLALMEAISKISASVNPRTSIQKLFPLINQLIRDDNFEVRMSFAENMSFFNQSIGVEQTLVFTIPLIMQMMNDAQWRLRLTVVESLPQLGEFLGVQQFTENISAPMMKWVEDPVYAVRIATIESIKFISEKFGSSWTKTHILPLIEMLAFSPAFTKRMTALIAINKIGYLFDYSICSYFLTALANDKIPNIRLNVAKSIQNLSKHSKIDSKLLKILEKLNNDNDFDVRFFAKEAKDGLIN